MKKLIIASAVIALLAGCASGGGQRASAEETCRLGNEVGGTGVGAILGPFGAIAGYGVGKVVSNVRCK